MEGRSIQGLTFRGHTASTPDHHLWWFGTWEPDHTDWVARSLAPGDVFVDVGAQIGYFSLLASQAVASTGRVVAVEANPTTYGLLLQNLAANDAANVRALNCAASAEHALVEVYAHPHDSCRSTVFPREGHEPSGKVAAVPLRDLVREDEWRRARLVKIDVEGVEPEVIAGMEGVFGWLRDDCELLVELNNEWGLDGSRGIIGTLAEHGFHAYRLPPSYGLDRYVDRQGPSVAERIDAAEEITGQTDVVFSRRDARRLAPSRS